MKLHLLSIPDYDGVHILGLYSTREKAIESFPFQDEEVNESNISEIEVDPPNGPDRYEMFHSFCVATDGEERSSSLCRLTEKKAREYSPRLSFDMHNNRYLSSAFARTKKEAEDKAREGLAMLQPVWQVGRYINSEGIAEIHHAHPSSLHKWEELDGNKGYAVHEDLETARQILFTYEKTGEILPGFVPPLNATTPKESDPQ